MFVVMLGLSGLLVSAPVVSDEDHQQARRLKEMGEILPLEKILEAARAEHPGQVIAVELESDDGRHVYEVQILDAHGEVWELYFNAANGRLIKREKED